MAMPTNTKQKLDQSVSLAMLLRIVPFTSANSILIPLRRFPRLCTD